MSQPKTFADVEVLLAEALPGYEARPQQQDLAQQIEASLATRTHLLAEAGTGTGKSLGYLIPAILHAVQDGGRTVVSTATRALQDQVANKDLPFLAEHLNAEDFLRRPFTHALLKGRSNYVCLAKVNDPENAAEPWARATMQAIEQRAGDPEFMGERDDLPEVEDRQWRKMTTTSEDCPGKRSCPFGEVCLAEKAKAKARAADVVVVNHALLLTDLKIKISSAGVASMLDEYESVIFDEAHEVEEYAGHVFGNQITEHGIRDTLSKVRSFARRAASQEHAEVVAEGVAEVTRAMTALWAVLEPGRIRLGDIEAHVDEFIHFVNSLGALVEMVNAPEMMERSEGKVRDKDVGALRTLQANVVGQYDKVRQVVLGEFTEFVRWTEDETMRNGEKRRVIKVAPISVASILNQNLFDRLDRPTAVLVSATLSVGNEFDYIRTRLGISDADELDVGTPFDYPNQAMLYVPRHLVDPSPANRAAWSSMAVAEMLDLVRVSDGRALLLFTSYQGMRQAYDAISGRVPYRCLMQGQKPNKVLAAEFAQDVHSVLFATRSFMTGTDFQGEACSLVVIDKLPFPVPTEAITEARCEAIRAEGGSDFNEYTIPVMSLVLKQAFGRLIRHRSDRGVVAILDPRLVTKGYGRKIQRALPGAPLVTEMDDVRSFFDALKEA